MVGTWQERLGAEEAHRAHNPRVPGSKPGVASTKIVDFISHIL